LHMELVGKFNFFECETLHICSGIGVSVHEKRVIYCSGDVHIVLHIIKKYIFNKMNMTEHNARQSGHINYIHLEVTVANRCTSCISHSLH
jgi:hypothetical protein